MRERYREHMAHMEELLLTRWRKHALARSMQLDPLAPRNVGF